MIRAFTFMTLFLHLTGFCHGQIHDTAWTKEISLPQTNFIKSTERIPLFNSDTFTVYSSVGLVVKNLKKFIKEFDIEADKELLSKLLDTSKPLDSILIDIQNSVQMKSRLNFRVADLIQKRKCLVYNKSSKSFEPNLFVTNYIKKWWSGIRFSSQTNQEIMDLRTGAF